MKSFRKAVITFITLTLMCSIVLCSTFNASAAWSNITNNYISTIFKVHNNAYNGVKMSNIGGVSAGTANNRLFVVKSSTDQKVSTLYYYNNIYNNKFATEEKLPLRIVFPNGMLGHANSMTVDDNYIYVSSWIKGDSSTRRYLITRIARQYIWMVPDNSAVEVTYEPDADNPIAATGKVTLNDGTTVELCKSYSVNYTDGTPYNRAITAIAKYSYNSTTDVTKLIISYSTPTSSRRYTIATFKDDEFTVVKNNYFELSLPFDNNTVTAQDIFYGGSSYGLYLLFWDYNSTAQTGSKLKNYVLRYNISSVNGNGNGTNGVISPSKTISITGSSTKYAHYELESLAYINRDVDHNMMTHPMFVFSSNNVGTSSSSDGHVDSIEQITYTTANQGVVDMYASIN